MTSDWIVGPFIFHDTIHAKRYLTMEQFHVKSSINKFGPSQNCMKFVAVVPDATVTHNLKFQISIIFRFQDNNV